MTSHENQENFKKQNTRLIADLHILRRHVRQYECLFVFFRGTGKPCKRGKHKSRNRKQICFHEAEQSEQSLSSNMACVTVCLLEKTETK